MCPFLPDEKCLWFFVMVSLAVLKLHCVSKIASSHLCLQSILSYGRGALHTPGLPAGSDATNSIGPLQDGRVGLQCSPPPPPSPPPFFIFCKSFNVCAMPARILVAMLWVMHLKEKLLSKTKEKFQLVHSSALMNSVTGSILWTTQTEETAREQHDMLPYCSCPEGAAVQFQSRDTLPPEPAVTKLSNSEMNFTGNQPFNWKEGIIFSNNLFQKSQECSMETPMQFTTHITSWWLFIPQSPVCLHSYADRNYFTALWQLIFCISNCWLDYKKEKKGGKKPSAHHIFVTLTSICNAGSPNTLAVTSTGWVDERQ